MGDADNERFKNAAEYLRHITTLSTGSLVIIVTFLGRFMGGFVFRKALVYAIVGFLSTVFCATVHYTVGIIFFRPGDEEVPPWLNGAAGLLTLLVFLSFLVGVISLAVFAIANVS